AWGFRRPNPDPSELKGVPRGKRSTRKLSQAAIDTIIAFEVASPEAYVVRYRKPIWPGGGSGVTIGVGYDLLFANRRFIDRDWPLISQDRKDLLYSVVGLSGQEARDALPSVQSVDIPWEVANSQFLDFLPYPTNEAESAFPNCGELRDDAFGALVSLVYNRGTLISKSNPNRVEMYEIRELMRAKRFRDVPERIRAMKRLWEKDRNARGLVKRREAEALLFERGLE
ncbi:glycoside hydrolase family protein, partial [Rubrivivax gelatinosus]